MNQSGIVPVEYKVVVKPEAIAEKTAGGIILADETHEADTLAQEEGILVAKSDMAFSDWNCRVPKVGERILFQRYAGRMVDGKDGESYRVFADKEVYAILGD